MKAKLMLEDGKGFTGESLGPGGERMGEVVLNTAVVGYQEMMTDPANAGKILVLTYPLVGNYGIAPKFNESKQCWLNGMVIKEKSKTYSNWQAKSSLDDFIKEQGLMTLTEVDTRTLAVHIRNKGEMLGIISTDGADSKDLLVKMESLRKATRLSILDKISVTTPTHLKKSRPKYRLAILDLGITRSIIAQLENLGCSLQIFPYQTDSKEILHSKSQGLIISNGPENDPGLEKVAENIKELIGSIPILGISTGHQVLAASLGAKITRMKLGHHGGNYPIYNPASYKGEITVQNHSYVVDTDSLNKIKEIKVTAYNLNDRTVEEIESKKMKFLGVQYIPASPGFNEVNNVFKKFLKITN